MTSRRNYFKPFTSAVTRFSAAIYSSERKFSLWPLGGANSQCFNERE